MSIDAIYLFYYLFKSSINGTYYLYCYFTGQDTINMTEIPVKELEEIKEKMNNQEKVLNELTTLLKEKKE